MPRIEYEFNLGLVGCSRHGEFEIPDEEWDDLTEVERENEIDMWLEDELANVLEAAWRVVE